MNCFVCGNPLHSGRAVFLCNCKALTHAQCWEKHVVESHKPPFTVGTLTINDVFKPNEPVGEEGEESV